MTGSDPDARPGAKGDGAAAGLDGETAKRLARDPDPGARARVASDPGVAPELLYYLVEDEAPEVRREVARNPSTPHQADALLARDPDDEVRAILAERLSGLLPELEPPAREKARRLALDALDRLADDHAVRVRTALATALADVAQAPPDIARRLARDVERGVAEPILRYCASLSEPDLLAVIASQPLPWALHAIARRSRVEPAVSTAIYEAGDHAATGLLLGNRGAEIPDGTLERIVEDSREDLSYQELLARRPALPRHVAVRLAGFVDQSVLMILRQRGDFEPETAAEIVAAVRRRIDWIDAVVPGETSEARVRRLFAGGRLDEAAIGDALSWGDQEFVRIALSLLAGIARPMVDRILESGSGRAVTALAWRAGLSMRGAVQIQARAANVQPRQMVNARNGRDYPLSASEMCEQLELFGVRARG